MDDKAGAKPPLGDEPPLIADGRSGPPDRREISGRWLAGTVLTGLTSTVLMGVALSAALDGREQLATPPEIALLPKAPDGEEAAKTSRLIPARLLARQDDRRRMEVSTILKEGDREVVRTLPFVHVRMNLAAGHRTHKDYPPFDPLTVFAEDGAAATASMGVIYGAKVESEVRLRTLPFPFGQNVFDENSDLSAEEVEQVVRNTGAILTDGDVQVAALHYVDPQRFGDTLATQALAQFSARIVQEENVSIASRDLPEGPSIGFAEDIIVFSHDEEIFEAFKDAGYDGADARGMALAIGKLLNAQALKAGTILCLGIEAEGETRRIVRTSIYEGKQHVVTIALDDRDQYVPANEPEHGPELLAALDTEPQQAPVRADLPRAYDGIYNAAYSYGLTSQMTQKLIRLLAADVDFQSRLTTTDKLEVFFSQPNEDGSASDNSEILYVSASFGEKHRAYYRFELPDGSVDYFDREGRSARPFLLRVPVPNGRFTSGFGMRRHPILGYSRLHTGVDWAAPRGTPIISSGDGVVESAGWSSGYGRQTVIRHANGYETSYNHQSAIAKGIVPGAKVRQGQVIGYVGATGQATGNHLHYELMVNGRKVDPMRVRLPDSKVLEGETLEVFMRERDRIEDLLEENFTSPTPVAGISD
ncbi:MULTISPECIES: M23 family metallopeptidase [Chelativorans]|uniref:Peptidase M23B n=1 Tax=Chelativorans sp. (strain BNC1) TaxID=266779 RepID=Q11E10_CHESB|nr:MULTISPECIES: M23 family metallopeptidase [Chelativorans]